MNGDAVTLLQPGKFAEQSGYFVHAAIEFLIGDDDVMFVLRFGDEDQRRFVFPFGKVAIDAVIGDVQLATHKPLPERRMLGVQRGVPILIPMEEFRVFTETLGKVLFAKTLDGAGIVQIGLRNEAGGRANVGSSSFQWTAI